MPQSVINVYRILCIKKDKDKKRLPVITILFKERTLIWQGLIGVLLDVIDVWEKHLTIEM